MRFIARYGWDRNAIAPDLICSFEQRFSGIRNSTFSIDTCYPFTPGHVQRPLKCGETVLTSGSLSESMKTQKRRSIIKIGHLY
jgi:hypothetical protein